MGAVWMRVRSDLRARWRGAVLLAVLLGLGGGIAMTAAAGARRTTTSYERLLRSSNAYDVEVQLTGDEGPASFGEGERTLARVAALPQVADHGRIAFMPATRATPGEAEPFAWDVTSIALVDRTVGRTLEVPTLLDGRRPNPDAPLEAAASDEFLRVHGTELGGEFRLQLATYEELQALFDGRPVPPTGPVVPLRIVGLWRLPHDVSIGERTGQLFLTPAFYERYAAEAAPLPSMLVRLRDGVRDVPAFLAAARTLGTEDIFSFESQEDLIARVDRALGVQSAALWALAAAVAFGSALVLGQAIARWLTFSGGDVPTLRALGMSRSLVALALGTEAALIAAVGVTVAALVSFVLTPAVPLGLARELEPDVGFFLDGAVLALGAGGALLVATFGGWTYGVVTARRRFGRTEQDKAPPSALSERIARSGARPTMLVGVRFALEPGRGPRAVPVRSVIAGAIVSFAALVAALVFGRSMEHMLATPEAYGWNWDLVVFGADDPEVAAGIEAGLAESDGVAAFSRARIQATTFHGREIEVLAVTPVEGRVFPTMLEGRHPAAADEVALATGTMQSAGVGVGDHVSFPGSDESCAGLAQCTVSYRIVGRLAFWAEGADPDRGAAFTEAGQAKLRRSGGFHDYLIRLRPGRDRETALADLEGRLGVDATGPEPPLNIANVARARTMPAILSAILALLALATIVHALVMAARRRQHDLAVLKTLGFVRRQIRAAVAWQSITTMVASLAIGVPAGVVIGRWMWILLAERLGIRVEVVSPIGLVAVGAVLVVALATLVSMVPARIAARARPAEILRTE